MTWEEGSELLEDAGLRPERIDVVDPDTPENEIIDTDPQAALDVTPGFRITVNVSSGAPTIPVPQVANQAQDAATAAITAAGLVVGAISTAYSTGVPAGIVISTNPAGGATVMPDGTKIRAGQTIDLVVSNGLVQVPDVSGQTVPAAVDALNALGLITKVVQDNSCSGQTVSSQSAIGDTPQRSQVTISYCAG